MRRLARRVPPSGDGVDPELAGQVESEPGWMYDWRITPGLVTPLLSETLPEIHATRMAMMERAVRLALAESDEPSVLDLACNEGWFGHRMLELGASRVLGLDIRDVNIRRAQLLARHYGIPEERLEFRQADVFAVDAEELGQFDVVLLLGLIYHTENPMGAVRLARACTKRLCVIEAQLTTQEEPIEWGLGPDVRNHQEASFAAYLEPDASVNPVASDLGILSMVPNRAAVEEMARVAGFMRVEMCEPEPLSHEVYVRGDRGQFLCWI